MSNDSEESEDDDEPFVSGPFCRHWGSLGDCDRVCATPGCGHTCGAHWDSDDACGEPDCECAKYQESDG